MVKRIIPIMLVILLVFSGIALAEEEKLILGYSQMKSDESQNIMRDSFVEYCNDWNAEGKTPQIEVITTNAEGSIDKQIADIETMIEMGINGIFMDPLDVEGIIPACEACAAAGVKVVEMRGVNSDAVTTSYMGNDEASMAELAYEWYVKKLEADALRAE